MNKPITTDFSDSAEDLDGIKDEILKEIQEYNKERDQIKSMLGKVGGKSYSKLDTIINSKHSENSLGSISA